jgi:hypothetical protein
MENSNNQNNNTPETLGLIIIASIFPLGMIRTTPGVIQKIAFRDAFNGLARHASADWGNVNNEDWEMNDFSLVNGERILSVYSDSKGETFWIITEADRSSTTILLPDDY